MLTTTDCSTEQFAGAAVPTHRAPPLVQWCTAPAWRHRAGAGGSAPTVSVRPGWPVPVELGPALVDFRRRSFHLGDGSTRRALEARARAFLAGFNAASRTWPDPHHAIAVATDVALRGFAYEGAAMSARLTSIRRPGRGTQMLDALLAGPGHAYVHLIHVGYGWLPGPSPTRFAFRPPPTGLLRWLSLDGAGFSKVFFGGRAALSRLAHRHDGTLGRLALPGAGRALWFLDCGDAERIAADISSVPVGARDELWSGVGLAMAYAGGVDDAVVDDVVARCSASRAHLAQGVAFAATATGRAGSVPAATAALVTELFGTCVDAVRSAVDDAADDLIHRPDAAAYEVWRRRIRATAIR